jgi:hypothetical protein
MAAATMVAVATLPMTAGAQCVIIENPADIFRVSDAVFVGTVVANGPTGARGDHQTVDIATLRVERSWKAPLSREVRVGSDEFFVVGKQYVVFAAGTPLSTSIPCDWAQPVEAAKTKLDWLFRTVNLADVYDVMLRIGYHGGTSSSGHAAKDATIAMPTLRGASKEWLLQFDAVPAELRRFATEQVPTRPHVIDASILPPGTPVVSAKAAEEQPGLKRMAFSAVLYTREGLDALVFYDAYCGGLCGEDGYAWLHRDSLKSPWRVAKKIVRRAS